MTSSIDQADTLELSLTISMITPAEIRANLAQIRYQRCVLIKHGMFPRLSDVQLLIHRNLMDKLIKVLEENDQEKVWLVPEKVKESLCFLEKVDNDPDSEDDDDDDDEEDEEEEEEEEDNNNSNISTTNVQPNKATKTNDVSTQSGSLH
ncbi:unnamed protein product [Adineta ricciae]|uniref:Uncharacterized protein n=1 Tax=Adineta ricciae TaxID=249248 RepID=A0A814LUC8_ADIRI|nr:unnamed protein product [Adineta ricciae]CAF1541551.1 unnamed protein product [Adineta ricciae]